MELWIRSQNKECLMKVVKLDLDNDKTGIFCYSYDDMALMGKYETKERALEILDEISSKIKNRYIVSTTAAIISKDDMVNEYKRLNYLYSGEFIMENPPFEIKPINKDVIYYEMPEE